MESLKNSTNEAKPQGMYLKDLLKRLGISRTTFYTHYADKIKVTKDLSGYRNIYLLEDIVKLEESIKPIEIVRS